jgi:zona occludens toxin
MFICIDGIMGSGKTYYAVHKIYNSMQEYYKIYTNINEFNFKYNIQKLDWSNLRAHLVNLNEIYKDESTDDTNLVEYLSNNDIIGEKKERTLLVIDEAHNFFDKKDDILTWFITYHRHIYIDVILITQSYTLLNREYYKLMEYYIMATHASRRLISSNFSYQKYMSAPFNDKSFVGYETLSHNKVVFDLYQSGDKVKVKSFARKYLLYAIIIIIALLVGFSLFLNKFFSPQKALENNVNNITKTAKVEKLDNIYNSFVQINCISQKCIINNTKIYLSDLEYLIKITNSRVVSRKVYSSSYTEMSLLVTLQFLNLITKEKNEKNNIISFID